MRIIKKKIQTNKLECLKLARNGPISCVSFINTLKSTVLAAD